MKTIRPLLVHKWRAGDKSHAMQEWEDSRQQLVMGYCVMADDNFEMQEWEVGEKQICNIRMGGGRPF